MDNREATAVLRGHLEGYRRRAYSELVALRGTPQTAELRGASGSSYQVEVEVHWVVSQAVLFEFSVRSTTVDCGRSSPSRRTSSSRPTVHSLESELTGCLTAHWSGRALRAAHCDR